jgi:UDP-N-acetylglucosamine diphosphorylase / glucose-1-phosphate thymidylyltransferase / UDP-N-acetylgalactosamine diphosphorylase / glucosamine-1-phosphate N-acetyltransferase / galactosamine-1-phosphate N-acetyltransferase
MKAVILAAGKGTRMGVITNDLPKPMVLVKNKPILEWIIEGMRDHAKITEFFIIIGYQGEVIRNYFGDGEKWNVAITYGEQKVQDGTGKAPEVAREWIGDCPFLLTYGDILIDPADYKLLREQMKQDGVVAVVAGQDMTKGGAVVLDDQDLMIDLIEKSPSPPPNAYYNAGIYLLKPAIFEHTGRLKKSVRGEYELTDALLALVKSGARLRGVRLRKRWVDVRDPEILAALNTENA